MEKITPKQFKVLLGLRIQKLRKEAKLTQPELALKIGFKDKQVVNNYEKNGANPTAYNLVLIAKALEVTLDNLLDIGNS